MTRSRVVEFCQIVTGDLRYALRGLIHAPGYAVTLLLTLTLGLGAVTTMLAIVDSVLLQPVRLSHPEQLFVMSAKSAQRDSTYYLNAKQIDALRHDAHSFSGVSAYNTLPKPVDTDDGARMAMVAQVTPELFHTLGVSMLRGHSMNDQDANAPVAVVNDGFWQQQFHGKPEVIGSTVKVSGQLRTVIGVLPKGLHFPQGVDYPAVFIPLDLHAKDTGDVTSFSSSGMVLARVKPGVSRQQALAEASSVLKFSQTEEAAGKDTLEMQSYKQYLTGNDEHLALLALLCGGGVLLLIACANAAILQIARATGRTAEMQVRSALGASFRRLVQQMLTESVFASLVGAALGGGLAYALVAVVRHAYGQQFARFDELAVHPTAMLTCAALAVLAGVLASLSPLLRLRQQAAATSTTFRMTRRSGIPGMLVALQVALTCVLLTTSGLFIRALRALEATKLGFDPHNVTTMVLMPQNQQKSAEASRQMLTLLLERFAALPGVQSAMTQTSIPFSNFSFTMNGGTDISGRPHQKNDSPYYSMVSSNFVHASGMDLLRGRAFQPADDSAGALVGLVNQAFAQQYLRGRDPIGVTLKAHRDPGDKDSDMPFIGALTIVGVVGNELQGGQLGADFQPMVYLDYRQLPIGSPMTQMFNLYTEVAVRSALPQAVLNKELRTAVKQIAPDMTEMNLAPMEQAIADSLSQRRLALRLVAGFGGVALLLAAIGLYGVLASSVAQRRKEIGIRMALGSSRAGATRLVARQAGRMVLLGLVLGVAGAWIAGHTVRSFLFGVAALDPYALAGSAMLLLAVCAVAAIAPAWRAAQLDPVEVLRSE